MSHFIEPKDKEPRVLRLSSPIKKFKPIPGHGLCRVNCELCRVNSYLASVVSCLLVRPCHIHASQNQTHGMALSISWPTPVTLSHHNSMFMSCQDLSMACSDRRHATPNLCPSLFKHPIDWNSILCGFKMSYISTCL